MYQPAKGGSQEGSFIPKKIFADGIKLYYEMNGWDRKTSVPTEGKLIELGLGWLCKDMLKIHIEYSNQRESV
jgi:hypothetical protein